MHKSSLVISLICAVVSLSSAIAVFTKSAGSAAVGNLVTGMENRVIESSDGAYAAFTNEGFDSPQLIFYGSDGKPRLELGVSPIGMPFIYMSEPSTGHIFAVDSSPGVPQMFIRAPGRTYRSWQVSVDQEGNALVRERGAEQTRP